MNILFPIAGKGDRFKKQGYTELKPFIKIKDKYIIEYAISSLKIPGKYFIICNNLESRYRDILEIISAKYNISIVIIDIGRDTSGQAETCFLSKDYINLNEPLVITNCDQYTPWDHNKFLDFIDNEDYDGIVSTYKHQDIIVGQPGRYSYIKLDSNKLGIELREKFAISKNALNGIFYYKSGNIFVEACNQLLRDNKQNSEKYVSLSYNYMIKSGMKVTIYEFKDEEFVSLGSPSEISANLHKL